MTWSERAGYTLLDLMTGIVMLGAVAGLGLPSMRGLLHSYQLSSSAQLVGFEISRARMQASTQQRFVCIIVRPAVVERQVAAAGSTDCSLGEVESASLPASLAVTPGEIRFDASGLAFERDAIELSNSVGVKVVTTDSLGKVTIS